MKSYLILVRHGESRWNSANKFTGWVDVPLSEVGVHEAMITARRLEDLQIDVAFTSTLQRAHETLNLILAEQEYTGVYLHKNDWKSLWFLRYNNKAFEDNEIAVHTSAKLNERYYGQLQGIDKDEARKKWGADKVQLWRRSYTVAPPGGESLKQVYNRVVPYFKSTILKHVKAHQNVLVVAHGNSLRAMIKHIEGISDQDIPNLELETGKPIIYEYSDGKLRLLEHMHSFDRPTTWHHRKKHERGYTSATVSSARKKTTRKPTSSSRKQVAKRATQKTRIQKTTRKKATTKTSTRKTTRKRTTKPAARKKTTRKSVAKKAPSNKVTGVQKKKSSSSTTRKQATKNNTRKKTAKKASSKRSRTRQRR